MENVKAIIKKTIAILTVFILILTQYVITGLIEATYAIDLLATQNANVQFGAYFKNGEEETTEIERSIDAKDIKLKIDVAVKEQGYFSGNISLENAGFKIKGATENSYINKVENNVVYLNQINAEETASIELEIEYLEEERIQVTTLNSPTTIKLKGTYTYSGGTETIDSGSDVKVIWNVPEGTKAELASKILTNAIYKVGEENKKIVQFLISSQLTNNGYPIKATEITATIPEGATKVEVRKRTTKSTNGDQEFTEANNVSREGNNVKITVNNNEEDGKISWMKGVKDIYVVTYEYPEDIDLSTQNITVNEKITTENNIELNAEPVQVQLNERKEGIATVSKQEGESNIYKGKIYSGEGRDITSYTLVYVDYVEGIKEIEIAEEEAKYAKKVEENGETNTVESNANVEIKSIKINKEEVASVLGDTWSIVIGETTLTNETEADENGDITVQISEGTKTITIKTSKPANNGTFVIETVKTIKNTTHTREEKKEFTILKDKSSVKYKKNNDDEFKFTSTYNIGLKDTESKASMQSEQQALIATGEAQPLNLTVILESNNEKQDLYKNPTLKIKLPKQIKEVTFSQKPEIMHDNELQLADEDYSISEKDGQKVINIELTGEQTKYFGEVVQGATIPIKLMAKVDSNTESSEEEVVLNYTNENATKYTDEGIEKVKVQIIANQNQGQEENQNENNGQGQQQNENQNNGNEDNTATDLKMELTAKVGGETINSGDIVRTGEIIVYTAKITNTGNTNKTGINIEATIPENTTLIERNPKYPKERHYSDDEIDAGVDERYLIEKTDRIVKNENINIKAGETIEFKYLVRANDNIVQNVPIEMSVKVKDGDKENTMKLQNNINKSSLSIELIPITRTGEEEIKAGYGCLYRVNIKNISNEVQKNVKIKVNNNSLIDVTNITYTIDGNHKVLENNETTFTIDSINPNSTVYMEISSNIKPYTEELKTADIWITATDSSDFNYRSNFLSEPVGGVKIEASLTQKSGNETSGYVKNGDKITYEIQLKNIGKEDTIDLSIKDKISRYVDINDVTLNGKKCEYIEGTEQENENNIYKIVTIYSSLKVNEELTIKINCTVKNDIEEKGTLSITNKAYISDIVNITETEQKVFYLNNESNTNNSDDNNKDNNGNDNNGQGNNNQGNSSDKDGNNNNNNLDKYTISGAVWKDTNKNGSKDKNEDLIEGIEVYAIDIATNSIVKNENGSNYIARTNTAGQYSLENLQKGNYLIVFEYDTKKYSVTEYKKQGVSEENNSDAIGVSKTIEGIEKNVAITDSINIENNYSNIDLGLIENQNEKIHLKKTVSNITVINKEGTKKYKFNNTELAKVEIASKSLSGSNIVIEYSIEIANQGSTGIYVKNIIDYLPSSLIFTSTMNKEWYKKDNKLYNSSLSNTLIKSGETKKLKLILTKKMTATNTGLINNKAQIDSIYSMEGKEYTSDEISSADVIISVKTGETLIYILFIVIIICMALEIAYITRRILTKAERR